MGTYSAYNQWSSTYDSKVNKTRDLEAVANEQLLSAVKFSTAIELGCGTGKNTGRIAANTRQLTAVDFSEEMLSIAKSKIALPHVKFHQADITLDWNFVTNPVELISCSLVLEHVEDLDFIFGQAYKSLLSGGHFYIGELHPFKQYSGSKARFENNNEIIVLKCFNHSVSAFLNSAAQNDFILVKMLELFDDEEETLPRIITFLFRKE
ncbi:class I SAM-dependent methyltransferase [soil metagenome]